MGRSQVIEKPPEESTEVVQASGGGVTRAVRIGQSKVRNRIQS